MGSDIVIERTLRSLPLWLLQEYLVELGGVLQANGYVQGDGWQAQLSQLEDFQVGSLKVGQVHIKVNAALDVVETFMPALEKKLLRAGG